MGQLPEFGWRLAQCRLASKYTEAVTFGTIYNVVEAASVGYLDKLVEGEVLKEAVAEARRLGGYIKQPAFAKIKDAERRSLTAEVLNNIQANVADCFPTPKAKL